MDYEKKYKEALETARKINSGEGVEAPPDWTVCEVIFPELKESEDERIRGAIIDHLKDYNLTEWAAWLKTHGEQKPAENIVEIWKDMRLEVYQQASGNRHEPNCSDDMTKMFSLNDIDEIIEKMSEQKTTDMVEPKFKIGDWILYSGDHYEGVRHITKIDEKGYYIERNGLPHGIIPFNHEICMRLWTIQDAKDGDVLVNGSNIFIFHFINDTRLMGYCHVNTDDGRFYDDIGKNECFCLIDAVVNPATKEQRDLLFQKMKESGYTWDSDKKELKLLITNGCDFCESENCEKKPDDKIEPIDEFEGLTDFERTLADICIGWIGQELGWKQYIKDNADVLLKIAVEMFNSVQDAPFERKSAWSEEDERIFKEVIDKIEEIKCQAPGYDLVTYDRFLSRLKSLKTDILGSRVMCKCSSLKN